MVKIEKINYRRYKNMNKKVILVIPVLIGVMFLLPLISAALSTMTVPGTGGNYSTTLNMVINAVQNGANNITNVTCNYSASGGPTTAFLVTILNDSAADLSFTSAVVISGLTDGRLYNVSCNLYNSTGNVQTKNTTLYASAVTFDSTAPTNGLHIESSSLSQGNSNTITWAYTDATSGLKSYNTTIVSPDITNCPTVEETGTTGSDALIETQTDCKGVYTVTGLVTDYSGNTNNLTGTFTVTESGFAKSGTLGSVTGANIPVSTGSILGGTTGGISNKTLLIILVIGIIGYFWLKKK
jgi:hypothetical protein